MWWRSCTINTGNKRGKTKRLGRKERKKKEERKRERLYSSLPLAPKVNLLNGGRFGTRSASSASFATAPHESKGEGKKRGKKREGGRRSWLSQSYLLSHLRAKPKGRSWRSAYSRIGWGGERSAGLARIDAQEKESPRKNLTASPGGKEEKKRKEGFSPQV